MEIPIYTANQINLVNEFNSIVSKNWNGTVVAFHGGSGVLEFVGCRQYGSQLKTTFRVYQLMFEDNMTSTRFNTMCSDEIPEIKDVKYYLTPESYGLRRWFPK